MGTHIGLGVGSGIGAPEQLINLIVNVADETTEVNKSPCVSIACAAQQKQGTSVRNPDTRKLAS